MSIPNAGTLVGIVGARASEASVCLLDVVRTNGDSFHWATAQISAPPVLTGNTPAWASSRVNPPAIWDHYYFPWLLNIDGIHLYRTMQVGSANFTVQNLSGNTLQRDVAGLLRAASFEGALFAFRIWFPQAQRSTFALQGRLTITNMGESQCQFASTPLVDEGTYDGNPFEYSETCQWNYGEPGCGDTTNNPCQNSYTTCRQPKRFFGVLNTFQVNLGGDTLAQVSSASVNRMRMV